MNENKLKYSKKASPFLNEMKRTDFSEDKIDEMWENISSKIKTKEYDDIPKTTRVFNFRLIAVAALFLSGIITFFIVNSDSERVHKKQNNKLITLKVGGTVLKLRESNITRTEYSSLKEVFVLNEGEIKVSVIPSKKKKHFEVKTDDASVIVKGTVFTVNKDSGGTTVEVERGEVIVIPSGKGRKLSTLEKGMSIKVEPLKDWLRKMKSEGITAYQEKNYKLSESKLVLYNMNKYSYDVLSILAKISDLKEDYNSSIKYYTSIINNISGIKQEMALLSLAVLYKKKGDIRKSRKTFENYLSSYPSGTFSEEVKNKLKELEAK